VHACDQIEFCAGMGRREIGVYCEGMGRFGCIFCTGITLSHLDLLGCVTVLKEGLEASEGTMVVSPELVIDLQKHT